MMKSHRNCGKIVSAICCVFVISLFYVCVFEYLEEGTITLHEKWYSSPRYVHNGERQLEPIQDSEETLENETSFGDNESSADEELGDRWDSWSEAEKEKYEETDRNGKHGSSLEANATKSRLQTVRYEKVMKILDFNHRKFCPLNYSFHNCKYSACEFTDKPEEADLVLINGARLKQLKLPPRHQGQLWMMYTKEPPFFKRFKGLARDDFRDQVNWTRCVFRDSTFRGHYGALESRPAPDKDYDQIYDAKRYQAAWFVSHCNGQSRRDEYVKRMLSEIDVHIFGQCGNRSCGGHGLRMDLLGSKDQCLNKVSLDYKFYISFENSMCSDYVTEKFYKVYENIDVIPVVRGGADYSELAPAGTYVNAKDFHSPEELGKYLRQLSGNKQEYIRMLKLKDRYINAFPKPPYPCELCKALHTRRHVPSTYKDILKWMKDHCWEPDDL